MARVCPPAEGCKQIDVNGRRHTVQRDGTFHVPDADVRSMVKGGECFLPSTGFAAARGGFRCECGWEAVINSCPRCQRTDLARIAA